MGARDRQRGFTLIELLVVILIIAIVSAVALPTVVSALSHRQVSEAARILQGAIVGARDEAIHANRPSGVRLLPDPQFSGIGPATRNGKPNPFAGMLDPLEPLACNRIIPIAPAPEYSEGAVSILPATTYAASVLTVNGFAGCPALVIEESAYDPAGLPLPPNSWAWNIRVGDKIQVSNAGPWYTVVGPVATANPEQMINYGSPGTASPLTRQTASGTKYHPEYLLLVNGQDDDSDGYADEGYDGVDNNGNGAIDELAEWEAESWLGSLTKGCAARPYAIARRPMPSPNAREIALPSDIVVDLTGWALASPERSRAGIGLNQATGSVDIMVNPDGSIMPTTAYSTPTSAGLGSAFVHLWLSERADLAAPGSAGPPYLPAPAGDCSLVTIAAKTGRVTAAANPDPSNPFAAAQQGTR